MGVNDGADVLGSEIRRERRERRLRDEALSKGGVHEASIENCAKKLGLNAEALAKLREICDFTCFPEQYVIQVALQEFWNRCQNHHGPEGFKVADPVDFRPR